MAYPSLDEVALRVRAGAAAAVIVEGEDRGGDAWIYGDIWFASRAAEVRFFPQDGWSQVVTAVETLRGQLPANPIFGLIDRDFTPDAELDALEPVGIYRSRLYSVENYLLDPQCWQSTIQFITRPRGGAPNGWRTEAEVEQQISESYRTFLPATAFNWCIAEATRSQGYAPSPPSYAAIPTDPRLADAEEKLNGWLPNAGDSYPLHLSHLQNADPQLLPHLVNGKTVLEEFVARLRHAIGGRAFEMLDYLNIYLERCPDPPPDAQVLLDKILIATQNWPRQSP